MSSQENQIHKVGSGIIRGTFSIGTAHVIFKVAGLLQMMVLSRYISETMYDVVYGAIFEGCIFSIYLIGEEVIGPSFLPVFKEAMDEEGESRAWDFADIILTVQLLILLVVVTFLIFLPGPVIKLFTAWTPESDPAKFEVARRTLVMLAPVLICFSLGSTTYMLLNGYKRFFVAAFGDSAWKFCVLIAVFFGMGVFGFGYDALIFGLLVGSIAKLGTHLLGMTKKITFYRPKINFSNPYVRKMAILMLPLIGGIIFAKVRDVFNNVTILSSLETAGLIQANSFGRKLYVTLGWLIPYSISIAMFPFFCEMVDRNDKESFGQVLSYSARMLLAVFIPMTLACLVIAEPLTSLILQGGEFTEKNVHWTATSMACYTLVIPAATVEYLLMQAFFANRKMISVIVIGVVYSLLSIAVSYVGIALLGAEKTLALAVIALGFTLSRTLKSATLIFVLKRHIPFFPLKETVSFLLRALAVGVITAGGCWMGDLLFELYFSVLGGKLLSACKILFDAGISGLLFLAGSWALALEEPFTMFDWLQRKLRMRNG